MNKFTSYTSVYHKPDPGQLPLSSIKGNNYSLLTENAWGEQELQFLCGRRNNFTSNLWQPLREKRSMGGYSAGNSCLWVFSNATGEPCLWIDFQWQKSGHAWLLPEPLERMPSSLSDRHLEHALKVLISAIFISRTPPVLTVFVAGIWRKAARGCFPDAPEFRGRVWSPSVTARCGEVRERVDYLRTTPAEWSDLDESGEPFRELQELRRLRRAVEVKKELGKKRRRRIRFFPVLFSRKRR